MSTATLSEIFTLTMKKFKKDKHHEDTYQEQAQPQYQPEAITSDVDVNAPSEDKWLNCRECRKDFILEAGEQDFLKRLEREGKTDQSGNPILYKEPKRCRDCRILRRQAR